MKKAGGIAVLLLLAFGMAGCSLLNTGPCAGFGCPAFSPTHNAQLQQAPVQTAQQTPHHHRFNPFARKSPAQAQAQGSAASAPAAKSGQ
ncbi:MAG TPA: hypothetical protein VMM16_03835 [Verrucomicrobiae bacterium]|nr:hypothetical protein [Verrucomicrobiae bacterium]